MISLAIDGQVIETTPEHPFYVDGEWVAAGDLAVGDGIRSLDDDLGIVQAIQVEYHPQEMYNLTVADAHTYFVGDDGLLVHNACSRKLRKSLANDPNVKVWNCVRTSDACEETAWQAHHIIPGEFDSGARKEHFVVEQAKQAGWNIDGVDNGIALPKYDDAAKEAGLPAHRGYHSNYSNDVESMLDEIQEEAAASAKAWAPNDYRKALEELTQDLRQSIKRRAAGQRLN